MRNNYMHIFIAIVVLTVCFGCVSAPYQQQKPSLNASISVPEQLPEQQHAQFEQSLQPAEHDYHKTGPEKPPLSSTQQLLDSAMEFYQTANEFWEQGDLDNALDALDKSYSILLEVGAGADPTMIQQKEDLRYTIAKRIMEVYASRFNVVNGLHKSIPLVMNKQVEKALKSLTTREKQFFIDSYVRSGRYRPFIVEALKQHGLPEELSWLPLIESGFKVRALSKARALGMWQFIASTGYKFGLERNEWIDERMDPEKSTMAAIAYLKELHGIFGEWTTALAAYNCGEANVLRVIRKQKIKYLDNFWDLFKHLPYETASYVPRFIAVLHILNNPEKYGFSLPPVDRVVELESVTIDKQVHLKTIARNINIDYRKLKDLNPELRKNITPTTPYALNVPRGKSEVLLAKLSDIPIYVPPVPPYIVHRVRRGESLSTIAEKYRSSVRAIISMNGLKNRHFIRIGQRLKVPSSRKAYSRVRPPIRTTKLKGNLTEYVVRKGDSLWEIAKRFNTRTKTIISLNNLKTTRLTVGQVILIPKRVVDGSKQKVSYEVRQGDSPYTIARKYSMSLAQFLKINNLTPRCTIFPGQKVYVMVH
ncbi:MAG: LysM peptidoglycan-binding domain-containing protein [Chitinivibrionales bacterium]|nr:LysM peptidoglycan-binding domain-containing protein [Chitinivibrionales bacterium]